MVKKNNSVKRKKKLKEIQKVLKSSPGVAVFPQTVPAPQYRIKRVRVCLIDIHLVCKFIRAKLINNYLRFKIRGEEVNICIKDLTPLILKKSRWYYKVFFVGETYNKKLKKFTYSILRLKFTESPSLKVTPRMMKLTRDFAKEGSGLGFPNGYCIVFYSDNFCEFFKVRIGGGTVVVGDNEYVVDVSRSDEATEIRPLLYRSKPLFLFEWNTILPAVIKVVETEKSIDVVVDTISGIEYVKTTCQSLLRSRYSKYLQSLTGHSLIDALSFLKNNMWSIIIIVVLYIVVYYMIIGGGH